MFINDLFNDDDKLNESLKGMTSSLKNSLRSPSLDSKKPKKQDTFGLTGELAETEQDWGEYEAGDEEQQDQGFFVAIGSEDEGGFVGMVYKDGGKWRESAVSGNAPYNWGGSYMSYLTPDDVMQHIRNDYGRHSQVKGPFSTEEAAMQYAQNHFDLGADEDDMYETKKPQRTAHEKFKAGVKSAGYDMDAGAKRLEDLLAKQKRERAEFEKKFAGAYGHDDKDQVNELSNKKLGDYKKSAGADASAADRRGDIERGNKRFRGIVKATIKQGNNDAKKPGVAEATGDKNFDSMMGGITSKESLNAREAVAMMLDLIHQGGASYKEALQQASVSYDIDLVKLQDLYQRQSSSIVKQGVAEAVWDRPSQSYVPRDGRTFGQTNHPREEHCDACGAATGHAGPGEDSNVDDEGNVYCDDCYADQKGVAEGKEDKIAQLKKDYATAVHWSKNDTNPHKREAARQKAEKIKAHLEKQYKQGVAEGLSKQFEIVYLDQSGNRRRKIVSGTSKEAVARQFKKQYKLEIEQVKQLEQGVAEGFNRPDDHRGLGRELAHETNNIEISINGRVWKIFAGKGPDSSQEFFRQKQSVDAMCKRKTQETGKKWSWAVTGAAATNEGWKSSADDKLKQNRPRNFVAKNAVNSGAGKHADKKKQAKQGIEKHKKPAELDEDYELLQAVAESMERSGYEFTEAANPAQQAAIAISMKKAGKKPHDMDEGWSSKYKRSINCSHPKGFSQKAHCAGKKKHNESIEMEAVCPDCGMCETHGNNMMEVKQRLDAKCWTGYKKQGTKIKGGVRVNNCVPK